MAETRLWTVSDQQPVQLRVALAQVDTRVGDLAGNTELVRGWTAKAAEAGAHLVVFPEMTLTGYPAEDLVLRESFARASEHAVVDLAASLAEQGLGDVAVVVGYLAHTEGSGPAPVDHPPVDDADRPGTPTPPRRPGTRPPCSTAARSSSATTSGTCPTTASSTRRGTSCPAPSCRSSGCTASTWR